VRNFERLFETEYNGVWDPKVGQAEYAAFYIEPIQGTGGYVVPPEGYFPALKKILDQAQVVVTPGSGFGTCGQGYIRISAFNHRDKVIEALGRLESGVWQVLFLDRRLPDLNAEELRNLVRVRYPATEVVLLDGDDGDESKLSADIESGESDGATPEMRTVCSLADSPLPGMIGGSRVMEPVYRAARLLARRETTVLITGPTGCGKELGAQAIHSLSPRATRAFVVVNCAAIPEALLEAELFGYTRGSFTGATQSYGGRVQSAHGGTLLLDEIGDMPLSLQPKLLRFLERKEIQRLGSSDVFHVDVRIMAATNADLPDLIERGRFREDLYYRLCAFPVEIPPLQKRPEDIALLAQYFVEKCTEQPPAPSLSPEAVRLLQSQPWAGNVRQLQNTIERALILAEDDPLIRPEHLVFDQPVLSYSGSRESAPTASAFALGDFPFANPEQARSRIAEALAAHAGNQTRAAKMLGISRRSLVRLLGDLDFQRPRKTQFL